MTDRNHEVSRNGDIAVLRLARPPANALTADFLNELADALDRLSGDENWRALVVTGSDSLFSAGVDLKHLPGLDLAGQDALVTALNRLYRTLYGLDRPTVAAIGGHAIAGGLILALCCDWRVATTGPCLLGLTEVKVGVAFPVSALEIARAELSPPVFRRFLLFGGLVDVETALRDGVVDESEAPETVLPRALEQARSFARLPLGGYAAVKAQSRAGALALIDAAMADGSDPTLGGWVSEEAREAALKVLAGKA